MFYVAQKFPVYESECLSALRFLKAYTVQYVNVLWFTSPSALKFEMLWTVYERKFVFLR